MAGCTLIFSAPPHSAQVKRNHIELLFRMTILTRHSVCAVLQYEQRSHAARLIRRVIHRFATSATIALITSPRTHVSRRALNNAPSPTSLDDAQKKSTRAICGSSVRV